MVESVQTDIVYHDNRVTAFIGSRQWPNNPGNTLVVPNEHFENVYDLDVSYAQDIQRLVQTLAIAMKGVFRCDGVSTRNHNEPAGNQDVWHYHVHVTPRWNGDRFYGTLMEARLMEVEARAEYASRIKTIL
jgi:histidine triad (HIT) family protein